MEEDVNRKGRQRLINNTLASGKAQIAPVGKICMQLYLGGFCKETNTSA